MRWRSSLLLLCAGRLDRVGGGQTRVAGLTGEKPKNTPAREGPRRGRCTLGCPRLGRSSRTSSHVVDVVEEQHIGLEK
jgi:hypothetical protein